MTWLVGFLLVACGVLLFRWRCTLSEYRWAVKGWDRAADIGREHWRMSTELKQDLAAMTQQRDDYRKRWLAARHCED